MCSQVHQLSIHIPRKHSPCTPQTISNSISLRYCAPISYSNSRAFTDRSAIPDGINQSINSLRRRRLVAPRIRPRGAIAAVGRSGYPPPHVACAPWYVLAGRHAHGRPRASAPSASAARRAWKSSPHQVVGGSVVTNAPLLHCNKWYRHITSTETRNESMCEFRESARDSRATQTEEGWGETVR